MFRHLFLVFFFPVFLISLYTSAHGADQKLSISAEAFGQLENIKNIKLSPSGKRAASLRNIQGRMSLITQSLGTIEEQQLYITRYSQGNIKRFHWVTEDRLVVSLQFSAQRYGTKTTESRLIAMDWDKKNTINMVKRQRRVGVNKIGYRVSQIQDDVISFLPDDPDHILLALDGEKVNYPDVYKVNIHNGDRKRVVKTRGHVVDWMADKKGVVRLGVSEYKTKNRIYYREGEDFSWKTIAKYDVMEDDIPFDLIGFSPDPKIIYVRKLDEGGFNAYYTYDLEKGEYIAKIAGKEGGDVTNINIDEDGNIRSYTYLDNGFHTVINDKLWQDIDRMLDKNFPEQTARITSYSKDKKKFIIRVTSSTSPGDYYFLDIARGRLDWFAEAYPGLDDEKLSPMSSVSYKARDGLEIPAYLSLPLGDAAPKDLPTIILPHGGPFARDSYGYDYWVQFLTTRGYAVLQMNYRGSTGYGSEFEELGRNEWGGKMLDDVNDGARWMIEQGYADPKRLCIMGGSYGGYAALQALVKDPDLYKCSISFAPVTDMTTLVVWFKKFLGLKDRYLPYIRNEEGSYRDISPYHHVDQINVPVLLVHGTEDRSVEYKHSEMFAKRMKKKKKDIRFITLDEGDHHLSDEKHRVKFLQEVEKFLEKNL